MHTLTDQRASGILMHISSLPGEHGIGDLGTSSRHFIDFLADSGQSFWQVLPLGPVSPIFGNSPYMSCSAFAGNPLFISMDMLIEEGRLQPSDLPVHDFSEYLVAFDRVAALKNAGLSAAWRSFQANGTRHNLEEFIAGNSWVKEYALFRALKDKFKHKAWFQWPKGIKNHDADALQEIKEQLKQEIRYYQFEQCLFYHQWKKVHEYARDKGVRIIGDLPIYVGLDSVDVWAHQEIFELNPKTGMPVNVAGVPPDYFSKNGQRWGNPLYRWNSKKTAIKKQLYAWWEERLQHILSTVDVIRIDHFRGFEAYWSVPAKEKTAINGVWKKGPGKKFFQEMEKKLGRLPVIAEDLGLITPAVEQLRDDLGYPGMKILLFAFDGSPENAYLPHNSITNCVVYSGTHDNDTAVGWFLDPDISWEAKQQAKKSAHREDREAATFSDDIMYLAWSSVARLSVFPMQDVLGFGSDCRMNTPGTTQGNWQWRCADRFITDELARSLREKTEFFNRLPQPKKDAVKQ